MKDCWKNGKCKHSLGKFICKLGKTGFSDEHCSLSGINVLLYLPLLRVSAKCDCLYNCCSVATTGNESLSEMLRLLTNIESHQNANITLNILILDKFGKVREKVVVVQNISHLLLA